MRTQKEVDDENKLVEHMLEQVEISFEAKGKTQHPFIEEMREKFDKWGSLTPKQIEAVHKFYDRID